MDGKNPVSIPVAAPVLRDREFAYVTDAGQSGWVSSIATYVGRLEQAFASFVGVAHAVSVSNGTVGLHLSLYALDIARAIISVHLYNHLARQTLMHVLQQWGIDSRPFFIPMHQLPHLSDCRTVGRAGVVYPQAERRGTQGLSLSSGCQLDGNAARRVTEAIVGILH